MKNQEILEAVQVFLAELSASKVEEIEVKSITQIDMTQVTIEYMFKGYERRSKTVSYHSLLLYFFKQYSHMKDVVSLLAWDKSKF